LLDAPLGELPAAIVCAMANPDEPLLVEQCHGDIGTKTLIVYHGH
jgi:hypothetical protein